MFQLTVSEESVECSEKGQQHTAVAIVAPGGREKKAMEGTGHALSSWLYGVCYFSFLDGSYDLLS